jgi:hypothetical protein
VEKEKDVKNMHGIARKKTILVRQHGGRLKKKDEAEKGKVGLYHKDVVYHAKDSGYQASQGIK